MSRLVKTIYVCALILQTFILAHSTALAQAPHLTVFAASSLTSVITEATQIFQSQTGRTIRVSYASSSALARQIEAGAEADLFLSANTEWMDYLADRDLIDLSHQWRRLSNQLVLASASELGHQPIENLTNETLTKIIGASGLIAMGDPDHVPAGIYAKTYLTKEGLWPHLRSRIARTDNVRAAVALAARGEVPLAIVYQTDLAVADTLTPLYTIPIEHAPIRYALALIKQNTNPAAADFFDFLVSNKGLALFKKYGFVILPE